MSCNGATESGYKILLQYAEHVVLQNITEVFKKNRENISFLHRF